MASVAAAATLRSRHRILVASADPGFRERVMKSASYVESVGEEAVGGAHALAKLNQISCDSVVLDRYLPDLDSAEVAALIRKRYPSMQVDFMDLHSQEVVVDSAEIQNRRTTLPSFSEIAEKKLESLPFEQTDPVFPAESLPEMIGSSQAMQNVYRMVKLIAPRDTTVLIAGETGTGKELIANAIHKLSPRARHPFVIVNCAAIPESLLESELFGYTRGAFTGAVQSRLGRIHVAQGGTLFLDEIGELPLSMQAKLLRFLQNGEVQRLGSSDVYRVDVRVVCATNVRLLDLIQAKQFRMDLYYRLSIFPIHMPPLRNRPEDIPALVDYFLQKLSAEVRLASKSIRSSALDFLVQSQWVGNVRELQHALERAFILSGNETHLGIEHFQSFREETRLSEI